MVAENIDATAAVAAAALDKFARRGTHVVTRETSLSKSPRAGKNKSSIVVQPRKATQLPSLSSSAGAGPNRGSVLDTSSSQSPKRAHDVGSLSKLPSGSVSPKPSRRVTVAAVNVPSLSGSRGSGKPSKEFSQGESGTAIDDGVGVGTSSGTSPCTTAESAQSTSSSAWGRLRKEAGKLTVALKATRAFETIKTSNDRLASLAPQLWDRVDDVVATHSRILVSGHVKEVQESAAQLRQMDLWMKTRETNAIWGIPPEDSAFAKAKFLESQLCEAKRQVERLTLLSQSMRAEAEEWRTTARARRAARREERAEADRLHSRNRLLEAASERLETSADKSLLFPFSRRVGSSVPKSASVKTPRSPSHSAKSSRPATRDGKDMSGKAEAGEEETVTQTSTSDAVAKAFAAPLLAATAPERETGPSIRELIGSDTPRALEPWQQVQVQELRELLRQVNINESADAVEVFVKTHTAGANASVVGAESVVASKANASHQLRTPKLTPPTSTKQGTVPSAAVALTTARLSPHVSLTNRQSQQPASARERRPAGGSLPPRPRMVPPPPPLASSLGCGKTAAANSIVSTSRCSRDEEQDWYWSSDEEDQVTIDADAPNSSEAKLVLWKRDLYEGTDCERDGCDRGAPRGEQWYKEEIHRLEAAISAVQKNTECQRRACAANVQNRSTHEEFFLRCVDDTRREACRQEAVSAANAAGPGLTKDQMCSGMREHVSQTRRFKSAECYLTFLYEEIFKRGRRLERSGGGPLRMISGCDGRGDTSPKATAMIAALPLEEMPERPKTVMEWYLKRTRGPVASVS
eukprot:TRINITY_DN75718_c0_g1_i1.p1 TRINITY_DN75718_c0_g1~~TRINITY_DN75718_c0_g1_i1.p1  ORF type:complete len:808 (+),score=116.84 TRINITY_DN75718_c0_g1_i1:203-2626(+)